MAECRGHYRSPLRQGDLGGAIETISESEEGFERVYQGSQILAVWPVDLAAGKKWTGEVSPHLHPATG